MNTIIKILAYLGKILNVWFCMIPEKLNIFAMFGYMGILYLMFGTFDMGEIQRIFDGGGILYTLVGVCFGIPIFWSFSMFMGMASGSTGDSINGSLNEVIVYRNQMLNFAAPNDAYDIMKKTSHIDVISKDPKFKEALWGFEAVSSRQGPSETYKDLMDKK